MAITIRVNLAVVAAAVVGGLVSYAWQSDALPWGRHENRYLITALVADFILAVVIEWITRYNSLFVIIRAATSTRELYSNTTYFLFPVANFHFRL